MSTDAWICKHCGYGPSEHYFGWKGGCVWKPKQSASFPRTEETDQ